MTDLFHAATEDTEVRLLNWAERDGTLFAEWEPTCTIDGRPFRIHGVNRFKLEGDKAVAADGFLDRLGMARFFNPAVEQFDLRQRLRVLAAAREAGRGDD